MKKKIRSIAELDEIAKIIVADWKPNNVYAFYGEMGTGKTTLIRSICRAAQVEDTVSSPTYGFVNEYYSPTCGKIFHFDLYRIDSIEEALDIGIEEYFIQNGICLIEWPEKISELLPTNTKTVTLTMNEHDSRTISM